MSTDRELLELAANAAGYTTSHPWNAERLTLNPPVDALYVMNENGVVHTAWNPLEDDGDALRLSAMLHLHVRPYDSSVFVDHDAVYNIFEDYMNHKHDKCAATRRAIVRAAAEIGKLMP